MHVVWYYLTGGQRRGPMSWDNLRSAAHEGAFGPSDFVWTPGYGAEWRRASTLDTLFPSPAPEKPASVDEGPPPLPRGHFSERSPFAPPRPDHRAPESRPRCLFSLRTAWANTRVVLLSPFSFARWFVFSLAVLLLLLGAQSEWALVPTASPALRSRAEAAGFGMVLESKLFSFPERWADAVRRGVAMRDPAPLVNDLGESLRDASSRVVAWTRSARPRDRVVIFGGIALLLGLFAAMRSWFLARSWTFLLGRIYHRDEPMLVTWCDARRPSREVLRGVLPLRLGFVALHAAALAFAVLSLSSLPEGAAGPDAVTFFFAAVFGPYLLDLLVMGFLRDFALPRVMLLGRPFRVAAREALRSLGGWYVRYLLLLALVAGGVACIVDPIVNLVGPALGSLPSLLLLLYAALVMPYQLLRSLWSLDLFFRLNPGARVLVPPRAAEVRAMQTRPPGDNPPGPGDRIP